MDGLDGFPVIRFSARLSVLRDTTRLGTPLVVSPNGLLTVRDNPSNQCSNAKLQLQARAGNTTSSFPLRRASCDE
jgi:hypothetical protein